MFPRLTSALVVLACTLLGACSNVPYRERMATRLAQFERYAGEPIDKFHFWRMENWEVLGNNKLVVRTTLRDAYLITVENACPELEWANSVGVTSTINEVSTRFDSVVVRGWKCRISEIRPVRYLDMVHDERAARASKG
jgi:hypothetical protein